MNKYICKNPIILMIGLLILSEIGLYYNIGKSTWGIIPIRLILGFIMLSVMYVIAGKEIFVWNKESVRFAFLRSSYSLMLSGLVCIVNLMSDRIAWKNKLLSIVVSSFFAVLAIGFFEEGLYRGIILNGMVKLMPKNRKGLYWAVILAGLLFGFMHVWIYVAGIGTNPLSIIVQMTSKIIVAGSAGILLSVIYLKTKNIWICMIIHALNDFPLFILVTILEIGKIQYVDVTKTKDLTTDFFSLLIALLISLPNIIISLFVLRKLKPEECVIWK